VANEMKEYSAVLSFSVVRYAVYNLSFKSVVEILTFHHSNTTNLNSNTTNLLL